MSAALTAEQQGRQRNSLETAERINIASRTKLSCSSLITDGSGLQSCDQDLTSLGSRVSSGAGLLGHTSFGGSGRSWGRSVLVLVQATLCASLMLLPSPILMLLGCDTFAFWPSVRALVGLETIKTATAFWWGINFGFLGDQGPGDFRRIVSQVLCEQSTLSEL